MKKRDKKSKELLPMRSLKDLVRDEDGFVSKETILKVGLMTAAGLGAWGSVADASSRHHANQNTTTSSDGCPVQTTHLHSNWTCY